VIDNWAQVTVAGGDEPGSWEPRGWHKLQAKRAAEGSAVAGEHSDMHAPLESFDTARPAPAAEGPRPRGGRGLGNAEEWLSAGSEALAPAVATAAAVARIRITYAKRARARFISHLELIDIIDRACRRARLPLAFSRGHRPAPRLRFSPGLPVGAESDCEMVDIDLSASVEPGEVALRFGAHLPEGLEILDATALPLNAPSPEHGLLGYRYRIDIGELLGEDSVSIDRRLDDFMAAATFRMNKRTGNGAKEIDARPLVARLARVAPTMIELEVGVTPAGSVKPTDLIAAIFGLDPGDTRSWPLHKTHAFFHADQRPSAAAPGASDPALPV